jgi:hypothetical protein
MYNVEVVEDELEAAAARAAMDQSGKYVNTITFKIIMLILYIRVCGLNPTKNMGKLSS